MYRLFVIAGSLVVVALFTALLAPLFIDWSNFKTDFEREASRILGQNVRVGGDASLRLLPLPSVSFENLEVGRNLDGSPLMTVDRFSLNAELMPFLSGEVRIVDMKMLHPRVNLKIEKGGVIAWTNRQELLVDPGLVAIENLTVDNGVITIEGLAGGRKLKFENLQASLSAKSILGPWRIEADGLVEGIQAKFKIATGILQDTSSIRVKFEATRADLPYRIIIDGPVSLNQEVLSWNGEFRTSPLADELNKAKNIPLPVYSQGRFTATPGSIDVADYRLDIGPRQDPYTITGNGSMNFGDAAFFKIRAEGRQIDLDRLEPGEASKVDISLESRLQALRSVLERIPVPPVKGEIDIALPAIVAGDTFIREVAMVVRPFNEGWEVRSLAAEFPGNTKMELSGRVGLHNDFGFNGKIIIASRQPSGFAAWISGNIDPAFRRLKSAGMSADVTISEHQASFENLELVLDGSVLRGKLQRLAPAFGEAGIIARFSGEKIDLEDLQAIYSLTRGSGTPALSNQDLDVSILAGLLEGNIHGEAFAAQDVDAHLQLRGGEVSIERLNIGDIYGARLQSTGRIENLFDKPNGNMKLSVTAAKASGLLRLAERLGGDNRLLAALSREPGLVDNIALEVELDTRANANGTKGQLLVSGIAGGTDLDWRIGFDGNLKSFADARLDVIAALSNPSPTRLFSQLGIAALPLDAPGPLSFNLELSGIARDGFATLIAANAPGSDMTARGRITSPDWQEFTTNLDITFGSRDIAPYLLVSGIQLPGIGFDTSVPASASFGIDHSNNNTKFTTLRGQIGGNKFSGEAMLERQSLVRPRLEGSLKFDHLSLPIITAGIFGQDGLDVLPIDAGSGKWSEAVFGETLYAGHDAKLSIRAGRVNLGGGLAGTNPIAELVLFNGNLGLNNARFGLFDGQVEASLDLKNSGGSALGRLRYKLNGADAKQLLEHIDAPAVLTGRLDFSGTLEGAGRSLSAMVAGASGSGIVELAQGVLHGIDPESFDAILLQSDVEGYEISSSNVSTMVGESIFGSSFALEAVNAAFSVNSGKLGIRNIVVNIPAARLSGNIEIDIFDYKLDANAELRFDPGKSAIVGADPEIGLSWNGRLHELQQSIDTSALEGFLSLRAFERGQRRVEIMEASILEQLRFRHLDQLANAKVYFRERKAEEARIILEHQLRLLREEEDRQKAEAAARQLEIARQAEAARKAAAARKAELARQAAENTGKIPANKPKTTQEPDTVIKRKTFLKNLEDLFLIK